MPEAATDSVDENGALDRLARAIAAQCRGRTAVWPDGAARFTEALNRRGTEPVGAEAAAPDSTFDTVVLAPTPEYANAKALAEIVDTLWRRVGPRGRLVVCAPNEVGSGDRHRAAPLSSRRLKKLLKPLGRPKLVTAQPFRWLVAYVDAFRPLPRAVRERYDVMAALCRGRVIELGCGPGLLAGTIAGRGHQVLGIDMNEAKIEQARRNAPDCRFLCSDILALPDTGGADYDTVVLAEVLEHVADDVGGRILAKAWSLVAPGGRLVVSVPNEDCVPHPNHVVRFDVDSLGTLLGRLARPTIVTEQPYKWLMMYVERPSQQLPTDPPGHGQGCR